MTSKKAFTVATNAKGELKVLYAGESASLALKAYEEPPKDSHFVEMYRFPIPYKRRRTQERVDHDTAVQEAHQKASQDAYAKQQAEAKAKLEKHAKDKSETEKKAKEENLKAIEKATKERAATLAATHAALAKEKTTQANA